MVLYLNELQCILFTDFDNLSLFIPTPTTSFSESLYFCVFPLHHLHTSFNIINCTQLFDTIRDGFGSFSIDGLWKRFPTLLTIVSVASYIVTISLHKANGNNCRTVRPRRLS
ncbi:hypothetical protein AQUCO_05900051v1 [Aquilegia coerulea]|uniref:Uncharacterized protein n=1 Tax=Aquilegia coerulea TaxID=218851 RepID=A0A2G5CFE0_AQUCA|nr:hypothetical protein AQUCO_05900051v1 [Aquilegia coerulea]